MCQKMGEFIKTAYVRHEVELIEPQNCNKTGTQKLYVDVPLQKNS